MESTGHTHFLQVCPFPFCTWGNDLGGPLHTLNQPTPAHQDKETASGPFRKFSTLGMIQMEMGHVSIQFHLYLCKFPSLYHMQCSLRLCENQLKLHASFTSESRSHQPQSMPADLLHLRRIIYSEELIATGLLSNSTFCQLGTFWID